MRLLILFGLIFAIIALWYLTQSMRRARRTKLSNTPLDDAFHIILKNNVSLYAKLPQALREELHGHINVFLDEKTFIGKQGVEITDEVRVVVAANACLLLLQGNGRRFTGFKSILIYPTAYVAQEVRNDGLVTTEKPSTRAGESWVRGPIVLSLADTLKGSKNAEDGHNVVIHEFAHKLDEQSGHMNGLPVLSNTAQRKAWSAVLSAEFDSLQVRARRGDNKVIDAYGTVSPAEFFAVATESFFEKPVQMQKRLPELYEQLKHFYNIDPSAWYRQ